MRMLSGRSSASLTGGVAVLATFFVAGLVVSRVPHGKHAPGGAEFAHRSADLVRPSTGDRQASSLTKERGYTSAASNLPIGFEPNMGQADAQFKFTARGKGYGVALAADGATLSLLGARTKDGDGSGQSASVRLKLLSARADAEASLAQELPGVTNYYLGNDPNQWRTGVPNYAQVQYKDVYPGIDLLYYGNQGRLEHDFIVAPGADPQQIAFRFESGSDARLTPAGDLELATPAGDLSLQMPTVYQVVHNNKMPIEARFEVAGDGAVHFHLGAYDRGLPLIIDPVLKYSTLLGGTLADGGMYANGGDYPPNGQGIAVDSAGEAVVVGATYSRNFPLKNPVDPTFGPVAGNRTVAYVTKMNAAGSALIYSTYLGGGIQADSTLPAFSNASGVAIDGAGDTYITGTTAAKDFPIANAYQSTAHGQDAFVTKLSPTGALMYSTYVGGAGADAAHAIAVDSRGQAFITGSTTGGFPTTIGSFNYGSSGIYVAALDAAGSNLLYSGILGGDQNSIGYGIAVDASGSAYITGITSAIPVVHAFQPAPGGNLDAFVTKINSTGSSLVYSTYLGGNGRDFGFAIAVDSAGDAYAAGSVWIADPSLGLPTFPTTPNAILSTFGGGFSDGFITKLDPNGGLLYSTLFGGNGFDGIYGIAVDKYKTVYVGGYTQSTNLPLLASFGTPDPRGFQSFVATLVPSGAQGKSIAYYSTTLGSATTAASGPVNEILGLAIDSAQNAYVTGYTWTTFPVTKGAFHTVPRGQSDAFISKLVIAADLGLTVTATPAPVATGGILTYTFTTRNNGPDWAASLKLQDPIPAGTTFFDVLTGSSIVCSAPAAGSRGTLTCSLPRLNRDAEWFVQVRVKVTASKGSSIVNTAHIKSNMQDLVPSNNSATLTTAVN